MESCHRLDRGGVCLVRADDVLGQSSGVGGFPQGRGESLDLQKHGTPVGGSCQQGA